MACQLKEKSWTTLWMSRTKMKKSRQQETPRTLATTLTNPSTTSQMTTEKKRISMTLQSLEDKP